MRLVRKWYVCPPECYQQASSVLSVSGRVQPPPPSNSACLQATGRPAQSPPPALEGCRAHAGRRRHPATRRHAGITRPPLTQRAPQLGYL